MNSVVITGNVGRRGEGVIWYKIFLSGIVLIIQFWLPNDTYSQYQAYHCVKPQACWAQQASADLGVQ